MHRIGGGLTDEKCLPNHHLFQGYSNITVLLIMILMIWITRSK